SRAIGSSGEASGVAGLAARPAGNAPELPLGADVDGAPALRADRATGDLLLHRPDTEEMAESESSLLRRPPELFELRVAGRRYEAFPHPRADATTAGKTPCICGDSQ